MNRLLAVALILIAVAVAVGTGAFTGGDQLDADEEVYLQAHDGPNGAYAEIDGADGELKITVQNLNARSDTVIEDIFDIGYAGDRRVWVWLEYDVLAGDVRFEHEGDAMRGVDNRLRLASGDVVTVGARITSPSSADGSLLVDDRVAIKAHHNLGLRIAGLIVGGTIEPGEQARVHVTVRNENAADDEAFVDLRAVHSSGAEVRRSERIPVDAGAERTQAYGLRLDRVGEWTIYLNTEQIGVVTVATPRRSGGGAPRRTERGTASVTNVTVAPREVAVDEPVAITATVRNSRGVSQSHSVEFIVDDETVATRTVELPQNGQSKVRYEHRFDRPGEYRIGVRGLEPVTVTVVDPENPASETPDSRTPGAATPDSETPGPETPVQTPGSDGQFGFGAALNTVALFAAALFAALLLAARRRRVI